MFLRVFSTCLRSEDHQAPWALRAGLAELDFLVPEDQRETVALQVTGGRMGSREKRESQV